MQCSSCGVPIESGKEQCMECGTAAANIQPVVAPKSDQSSPTEASALINAGSTAQQSEEQTSKLIEFPGVSRSSIPQWRKDLSERVREVQEKRAREDALDKSRWPAKEDSNQRTPQLELLPQAESGPVNPLVAAALRRIERANEKDASYVSHSTNTAGATAVAYAAPPELREGTLSVFEVAGIEASRGADVQSEDCTAAPQELIQHEKPHNLVVVPPRAINTESPETKRKPRRMIAGDPNDPALNYLDSVLTTGRVEAPGHRQAPVFSRLLGALADLLVVGVMCSPFGSVLELANANWQDSRVAIVIAAVVAIVSFLYFTISTALAGRTFGMRLFSLRIVDARTGLIPTGKQSAGRSIIYLGSLMTLGIATLYALFDSERQTAHDRLTHTIVIHV